MLGTMSEQETSVPVVLTLDAAAVPASSRRHPMQLVLIGGSAVLAILGALLGYFAWDDSRSHQQTAQQTRRAADLAGQVSQLQYETARLNAQLDSLRTDNTSLQTQARNPTLPMWNSCGGPCAMSPSGVRVGSIPDTFQLQIRFTADVPVRTYVFTFHQWTQFDSCSFNVRCVTGNFMAFDATTSFDQTIDEAEGCSGYVWVLQADREGTIKPDVRVHYKPADHPTGVCAANP
jgi:hypothetical protein